MTDWNPSVAYRSRRILLVSPNWKDWRMIASAVRSGMAD
jgi:hypothetical protein